MYISTILSWFEVILEFIAAESEKIVRWSLICCTCSNYRNLFFSSPIYQQINFPRTRSALPGASECVLSTKNGFVHFAICYILNGIKRVRVKHNFAIRGISTAQSVCVCMLLIMHLNRVIFFSSARAASARSMG